MARGRLFLGKVWEDRAITLIYCFNTDWMLGGATINLQEKKALMRRRGKENHWMQTFQFHISYILGWKSYNQVRQGSAHP